MFRAHQEFLRQHGERRSPARASCSSATSCWCSRWCWPPSSTSGWRTPRRSRSNVRLGLLALVVIINLALVRIVYSLGGAEFFLRDGSWASTLPYVAPTALAPLIVAILIDAGSAIFMALLISIFTGVIYGNRLDLLVLTFLASLVAIFVCRDAQPPRAGSSGRPAPGGLTVAAFAALIGIADQTPVDTLVREMAAGPGHRAPDRGRRRRAACRSSSPSSSARPTSRSSS